MKRSTLYSMLVAVVMCTAPMLVAAAKVGQAAPDFRATASNGKKSGQAHPRRTRDVPRNPKETWANNNSPATSRVRSN